MKKARNKQANLRLTEEESAFWSALSDETGVGISSLIRTAAEIGVGIPTAEEANLRQFPELLNQLSRAGNNLNQLAYQANKGLPALTSAHEKTLADLQKSISRISDALVEFQQLARKRDFKTHIADMSL